jgi:hypothetical protein
MLCRATKGATLTKVGFVHVKRQLDVVDIRGKLEKVLIFRALSGFVFALFDFWDLPIPAFPRIWLGLVFRAHAHGGRHLSLTPSVKTPSPNKTSGTKLRPMANAEHPERIVIAPRRISSSGIGTHRIGKALCIRH